ncbi:hypothetical protein DXG03_009673, partial [Asterophora parasitica]
TGGTLAGTGQYIKNMNENVVVALADPEGSGLYNKVKHGVMFDRKESEGTKRRHQVDTVVEGMYVMFLARGLLVESVNGQLTKCGLYSGINRLTNNIDLALPIIDDVFR